jgi:hypothetical protein
VPRIPLPRPALALLTAGLLAVLVGCLPYTNGEDVRWGGPRTVAFIGDSITEASIGAIAAEGQRTGWYTFVDATGGAMVPDKLAGAEAIAESRPFAAVVNMGTNDGFCAYTNALDPGSCRVGPYTLADLDRNLTIMATGLRGGGACVVGVVPYMDFDITPVWKRLISEGTVQGLADWRSQSIAHHDAYLSDEIGHLLPAGQAAYARFLLISVSAICATSTPAPPALPSLLRSATGS